MKKLFITIAFVAAAMFANAQFFVGGGLGFTTEGGKVKSTISGVTFESDAPKAFTFEFVPTIGYMFNDNMGVGIDLGFGFSKEVTDNLTDPELGTYKLTEKATTIAFAPFFRYVFAEIDNFKFYGDVKFAYATSKPKDKYEFTNANTTVETDGAKMSAFAFGVIPGIQYNFTDNISINAKLNLLSLGYTSAKYTSENGGDKTTISDNQFGFGVNQPTDFEFGFFYTF